MISMLEAQETNQMITRDYLDVRTITMGISLMDCAHEDLKRFNEKIYDKVTISAQNLVKVGEDLEKQFGIPIVNKRISVSPIGIAAAGCNTDSYVATAHALDRAARETGVNFIGGFSALVQGGSSKGNAVLMNSIPEALSQTERVCASVNVGSTKSGINMDAVQKMGQVILETAKLTADQNCIGCAKLVVFCNSVDDNPFMAGAYHGVGEPDVCLHVGISGPGVVKSAIEEMPCADFGTLCETIKRTAFKITRVGQLVAQEASKRLKVPFGIIDLSLAPTPQVGDSIAEILEAMGLESVGAPGTTAALAMLNDCVKKGGIMASSYVGGLSGAFIPVSEDQGMINAVQKGALTLEKLEAMTCVCSVGLDMVVVPGDIQPATISGIIADEAAIGMINGKTTAVRLIPAIGKKVGDTVEFGGLLGHAPVMPVNPYSCEGFIARGGRIPAPVHSFKN